MGYPINSTDDIRHFKINIQITKLVTGDIAVS